MLSIIVCSKHKSLEAVFQKNIEETVGIRHELISIDNSEGKYSIFEAYNQGIALSRFPFLCFVHEDVKFHTENWGEKLVAHLSDPGTGIVGVAGSDMITQVPAGWAVSGKKLNIIQSDKKKNKSSKIKIPHNFEGKSRDVILLDGVFLCMRKEMTEKINFNEHLKGFHGYDLEISLQSIAAGFINKVVYDIELEHFSKGRKNSTYYRNLISVYTHWERIIPLYVRKKPSEAELLALEKKKLDMLTHRVLKRGFGLGETISLYVRYSRRIGIKPGIPKLMWKILIFTLTKMTFFWSRAYYR